MPEEANYLQEQYTFLRDGDFCSLESSEFRVIVLIPDGDRKGFFAHSAGKKLVLVYRLTRSTKCRAFRGCMKLQLCSCICQWQIISSM